MQTVTIQTTQNIDIDYEVAGVGERILAGLIDLGIFIALGIVVLIFVAIVDSRIFNITIAIIIGLMYACYDLFCEIVFNGQSFGKRMMKIKVISLNGARPSFSQYLLRWLFRIVDISLTYSGCAILCIAISAKKQRVGDMVAGTTLIKTASRTNIEGLIFSPVMDGYTPVYNEVTKLSDSDITLIHEIIANYKKTGNSVLVYNMATRIKDFLVITNTPGLNDYEFLQTVLKDYNYLTAAMDV